MRCVWTPGDCISTMVIGYPERRREGDAQGQSIKMVLGNICHWFFFSSSCDEQKTSNEDLALDIYSQAAKLLQ